MKKSIFLFFVCSFFSFSCIFAQFSVMPKAGINFSNVAFSNELEQSFIDGFNFEKKSVTGFIGGAAFQVGLLEGLSVQPELLFIQKGFLLDLGPFGESKFTINYLEVPLLFKYTHDLELLKIFVNLGPSFSLGLGGKVKTTTPFGDDEASVKFGEAPANTTDVYFDNRLDLGLQGGLGVAVTLGPGDVVLEGRYGYGFSNLFDKDEALNLTREDVKTQHRVISIQLGYSIPLGNDPVKSRLKNRKPVKYKKRR